MEKQDLNFSINASKGTPDGNDMASKHDAHSTKDFELETGEITSESHAHFNIWSTLGITFSVTATPIAIGTYLALAIGVGGSPVFVFAYILTSIMNMIVCLSMAELASAFPHSSGMY